MNFNHVDASRGRSNYILFITDKNENITQVECPKVELSEVEKGELQEASKAIYEAFCQNVMGGIARSFDIEELSQEERGKLDQQIVFFSQKANNDLAWKSEIMSIQADEKALEELKEKNSQYQSENDSDLVNTLWSCAESASKTFLHFMELVGFPMSEKVQEVVHESAKAYMRSISEEIQKSIEEISPKGLSYLSSKYEREHIPKPTDEKKVKPSIEIEVTKPFSTEQKEKLEALKAAIRKEISEEKVQGNNVNQSTISGMVGCFMNAANSFTNIMGMMNALDPALKQMQPLDTYSKTVEPLSTRQLYNELSDLVYEDIRREMQEIEDARIAFNLENGTNNQGLMSNEFCGLCTALQGFANTMSLNGKTDWVFTPDTILKTCANMRVREKIDQYVERQNKILSEESTEKAA